MQIRKRIINWKDPAQREKALEKLSKESFGFDVVAYVMTALVMPILLVNASAETCLVDVVLLIASMLLGAAVSFKLLKWNKIWHLASVMIMLFTIALLATSAISTPIPLVANAPILGWLVGQGIGRLLDRIVK
jgi:hypothetical protein